MRTMTTQERKEAADDAALRIHAQLAYRRVKPGGYAAWGTTIGPRAWVVHGDYEVMFAPLWDQITVTVRRRIKRKGSFGGDSSSWVTESVQTFRTDTMHDPRTSPHAGGLTEAIHYFAAVAADVQKESV